MDAWRGETRGGRGLHLGVGPCVDLLFFLLFPPKPRVLKAQLSTVCVFQRGMFHRQARLLPI